MVKIPLELVQLLMELGLLENEAKLYIALVIMDNADVKKLINFVGLSRPNAYESLRMLEEKGIISLINTRPMVYQAISPEIGLEILFKKYRNSKEKAMKLFLSLDKTEFSDKSPESVWNVFKDKSIDYKIKTMLKNTRRSIFLFASPDYLNYFKKIDKDVKLDITIFSDDSNINQKIEKIFRIDDFHIISKEDMFKGFIKLKAHKDDYYERAFKMFNYENLMVLIVDDNELLYILPSSEDSLKAFNTKNNAFILITKIAFKDVIADPCSKAK